MVELGDRIARQLTLRTVAVLAVLGVLAVTSFLGVAAALRDAGGGIARVDAVGRQIFLVDHVALAATRLAASTGEPEFRHWQSDLQNSLDQLDRATFGSGGKLAPDLANFVAHGRFFAAHRADADLRAVQDAADGELARALGGLATATRSETNHPLTVLFGSCAIVLMLTLLALVLAAVGVFHPLIERIQCDIAERLTTERDLRESEERLWRILEESPVGVSVSHRLDGRVVFANTRFCEILGRRKDEVIGAPARDHYVDDAQRRNVVARLKTQDHIDHAEVEFRRKDGSPFWALLTIRPARFEGKPVNLAWIYDISWIKAAEERLRLTAKVVETASEAVMITGADNVIQFVNPAFSAITEYSSAEMVGQSPNMLQSGRHDRDFYRAMWRALESCGRWQGEIWNRRKSGEFYAEWLSIVVIRDALGQVSHHIAVFSDITHRKEDEERVWRQANYDALTGLPNRSLFLDRLNQAVRQSARDTKQFALMFIDLDGFKQVNDSLGHAAGDLLLQQTAERLSQCVRASDTVARLAGDEFTIIMQGAHGRDDGLRLAAKILSVLSEPFGLEGATANVQGSIGIACYPADATEGPQLLHLADQAMYAVKKRGKNGYCFAGEA